MGKMRSKGGDGVDHLMLTDDYTAQKETKWTRSVSNESTHAMNSIAHFCFFYLMYVWFCDKKNI
jgi:hypothetical protein